MLRLLKDSVDIVFNDADPTKSQVVMDNLYLDKSWFPKDQYPFFWILLGHQETLWPLTRALGKERAAKLPFGSAYFFEYASYQNKNYVMTRFRDDKGVANDVEIDCEDP